MLPPLLKRDVNSTNRPLPPYGVSLRTTHFWFTKRPSANCSPVGTCFSQKSNGNVFMGYHHKGTVDLTRKSTTLVIPSGRRLLTERVEITRPQFVFSTCCSSFRSCFSSFEVFTRCIIRNWPFRWKTGMSNLYLSYQVEFSGSVMSTSCNIN